MDTNLKLMDSYSRPKFYLSGSIEWLCFRLHMLSSIMFAFSLMFLISVLQGTIDLGIAGLAVAYGLNLNMLQALVCYVPHMPLVLRGLTCAIPGGMKTGIVGRTGSSKSTLIQIFFCLVEPVVGQILIDGLNISTIGLICGPD
ncbi:Abc transporter c family member [Thalictrum thalictroides]|uniref:Abc transporter c family member n=1 Tax=Thalictrum thalictroides TaxID=46969 RepID=A0A7J6X4J7_THATH|nr:Abc transporter c family member [Thalictrum thalictroides]